MRYIGGVRRSFPQLLGSRMRWMPESAQVLDGLLRIRDLLPAFGDRN